VGEGKYRLPKCLSRTGPIEGYFVNSLYVGGTVYWIPRFDFPQFLEAGARPPPPDHTLSLRAASIPGHCQAAASDGLVPLC
jgi:hypothetical protein